MKKNYSIVIAIALIVILIVATLCIKAARKNELDNMKNDLTQNIVGIVDEMYEEPYLPDVNENVEWDEEGNKVNVSDGINKEKMTFGNIDLTNISIRFADGITDFSANVKNNSDKEYPMGLGMTVIFYDSEQNIIFETYVLTSSLSANGESNIQARFLQDCSYAETFDIIIEK